MSLALFDLDNTLIAGDSDHLWGEFLAQHGYVDADAYRRRNDAFYAAYQRGELDIGAYLEFAVEPLTRFSGGELAEMHRHYLVEKIEPIRLPKAEALIDKHRQQGDVLAIVTSTNRFITQPIAQMLGVPNLVATELEIREQRYTGRILGEPCYQAGKITHLQRWCADQAFSMTDSYFYSDSINDLPLLSEVDHPVAVNPDPSLQQHAKTAGWAMLDLRN